MAHSYELLQRIYQVEGTTAAASELVTSTATSTFMLDAHALWIAVGIIVAKEGLFRWTLRVANRLQSPVLKANAWHHRSDATSTVVALGGIFGAQIGYAWLDPLGGMVVAAMIFKAGFQSGWSALKELTDRIPASSSRSSQSSSSHNHHHNHHQHPLSKKVQDWVTVESESAMGFVDSRALLTAPPTVRLRKMGTYYLVDIRVDLRPNMPSSIPELERWTRRVRSRVMRERPDIHEVLVDLHWGSSGASGASDSGGDSHSDSSAATASADGGGGAQQGSDGRRLDGSSGSSAPTTTTSTRSKSM